MTRVLNTAESFVEDELAGFCDLYPQYVTRVPGGVVRAVAPTPGKVAVVIGGGSGHYPAFGGYVGPGLADGAVVGDVFTSPSARQVQNVARAASHGGGVVLGFGNYAGDVLNFGLAAERLRAEGIPTGLIAVTDDVASAPKDQVWQRRGIAGDVVVFKIASAAAEAGYGLDDVLRVARAANDHTRSLGVAFSGCTLPGASEPLFAVPQGTMAMGLGIHGEPGIEELATPSASELARMLVESIIQAAPAGQGNRVAVLLNGLGATKYEELFVLWSAVAPLLRRSGLEPVGPEVGELVTSLDMAGASLTVSFLDEETERLWLAPARSAAFTRTGEPAGVPAVSVARAVPAAEGFPPASEESTRAALRISRVLSAVAAAVREAEEDLGRMDAIAGDGDHGRGMARGSAAAAAAAAAAQSAGAGAASTLAAAADAWADRAGGTSGALWGVGLLRWAQCLSDSAAPDAATVADGARAALDGIVHLGRAAIGDKTLVDALAPFVHTLTSAVDQRLSLAAAWRAAAMDATAAAESTAHLRPRLGRARPLAERSVGHPDAGAMSLALCARTAADVLDNQGGEPDE
jgi:dihydroxyacetone kinase